MKDLFGNIVEPPGEIEPIYVRVCVVCECAFDGNKYKACPSGCRQPIATLGNIRHLAAIRVAEGYQVTLSEDSAAAAVWVLNEEVRHGHGASLSMRISMEVRKLKW